MMGTSDVDTMLRQTIPAAAELFSCNEVELEVTLGGDRLLLRGEKGGK